MTPIERRRAFKLEGYVSLGDLGFDGDWVTPYQIGSCSPTGPALVAYHWLDVPSFLKHESILRDLGYLPGIPFNKVLDMALELAGLTRADIYVTQAFHLLPATRSQRIPTAHLRASFDAITRYELSGRKIVALGTDASRACRELDHVKVSHPSARGLTYTAKAEELAAALMSS